MKKIFSLMTLLLCCTGAFFASSCSDDKENEGGGHKEITKPFESVTAVDGAQTATAVISDADKTIKFNFNELTDISAVKVTFNMAKGALLKTPSQSTATLNLDSPYSVVFHNGVKEVTYTLTGAAKVIPMPIIEASVGGEKATIEGNTITISYKSTMNINAMVLDLTMETGATVKSPTDKTFNLEYEEGKLVVAFMGSDYNYTVKVKDYVDPLLGMGWTDVTATFGELPNYIKVYKNENLLNNAATKSIGYITIMGPKATMGAIGDGITAKKTVKVLAEANPNWKVMLVGIAGDGPQQTIIRDGQFFQSPVGIQSYGTFGQNKDGSFKAAWTQKFDNKLYAFPLRNGTAFEARKQADGTVWDAQTAVSGIPMILWNSNVLTAEQTICNDGGNNNWYDGSPAPRYARAAIGLTAYGKVIAFCGQQVDNSVGLTMLELAQLLKDCGCVSAVNFEGSGTPDMYVNQKPTATNKSGAALKPVQVAIAFK